MTTTTTTNRSKHPNPPVVPIVLLEGRDFEGAGNGQQITDNLTRAMDRGWVCLSIRDAFAALAMAAILNRAAQSIDSDDVARDAYLMADSMLAARVSEAPAEEGGASA